MLDVRYLWYIIPISIIAGIGITAFFISVTQSNREYEVYQEGYNKGYNTALQDKNKEKLVLPGNIITLEEIYDRELNSDFNKFTDITGGIIYTQDTSGQLCMLFIDDTDVLSQYFDYDVITTIDVGQYQRFIIKKDVI